MKRSETFGSFAKAFAQFQAEITNPKLSAKNPHFGSKYAPLAEVLNTVRPVLAKYGLSVQQDVSTEEEQAVIVTVIMHESGEWQESSPMKIPAYKALKDGRKTLDAQTIGSAISYGKRYQLQAAVGVAADEDDDGESSADRYTQPLPSIEQVPSENGIQPSKVTLAARYQLATGSRDGFEDYMKKQYEKGYDNKRILQNLEYAKDKKQEQNAG